MHALKLLLGYLRPCASTIHALVAYGAPAGACQGGSCCSKGLHGFSPSGRMRRAVLLLQVKARAGMCMHAHVMYVSKLCTELHSWIGSTGAAGQRAASFCRRVCMASLFQDNSGATCFISATCCCVPLAMHACTHKATTLFIDTAADQC